MHLQESILGVMFGLAVSFKEGRERNIKICLEIENDKSANKQSRFLLTKHNQNLDGERKKGSLRISIFL